MKAYHNSAVLQFDDSTTGNAGAGVPVTVRLNSTQALVSIFDLDEVAIANPTTTDSKGNYAFKTNDGVYDIIISEGTGDEVVLEKVQISEFIGLINDLSQAYEFATVAEYKAFTNAFPIGKSVYLADRGADFKIITDVGGANDRNIIANTTTGQSVELITSTIMNGKAFGAKFDGTFDDYLALNEIAALGITGVIDSSFLISVDVAGDFISYGTAKNFGTGAISVKDLSTTNQHRDVTVWAHRGFDNAGLQNSMLAFSRVLSMGTDAIELDINYSTDGTIYCFHDTTVDALTNGTGAFQSLNDVYIDSLKYTATIGTKYEGEQIPKLVDFLIFARANNLRILPEIKGVWSDAQIQILIDLLDTYEYNNDKCILQAGYIVYTELFRAKSPTISVCYLGAGALSASKTFIDRLQRLGNSYLLWNQFEILAEDFVGYCEARGVKVIAYTITQTNQKNDLLRIGIYDIVSDVPFLGGQL